LVVGLEEEERRLVKMFEWVNEGFRHSTW